MSTTDTLGASEFDQQVAVTRTGPGTHEAELSPGWVVGGGVNGGYVLSVIGNAIRDTLADKPDPVSVSAYYLAPSEPGPATVATTVLREGGSLATVSAELSQGGDAKVSVLATYGDLAALPDDVRTTAEPPALPPIEECVPSASAPEDVLALAPMMGRFDMRVDPSCVGWAVGQPSGRGMLQTWFRLVDGREPDPLSMLMTVDTLPPVTYDLGLIAWAPTLELTVHVRAVPAPGWLIVRHATRNIAGGMFEEDCEVWDSAGRLVTQSRQLVRMPRTPPPS